MCVSEQCGIDGGNYVTDDLNKLLLREIDHRAKNSFQLAMTLLRLQAARSESIETKRALTAAGARLGAICHSHARLHASCDLITVPVHLLLSDVCLSLLDGFDLVGGLRLRLDLEPIEAPAPLANAVGMIASEAVMNSLKYAFDGRDSGLIEVGFHHVSADRVVLTVSDDGAGPSADHRGLGLELMERLARQYRGGLQVSRSAAGGYRLAAELAVGRDRGES
jgi:two-component sensor histidine kinase